MWSLVVSHSFQRVETYNRAGVSYLQLLKKLWLLQHREQYRLLQLDIFKTLKYRRRHLQGLRVSSPASSCSTDSLQYRCHCQDTPLLTSLSRFHCRWVCALPSPLNQARLFLSELVVWADVIVLKESSSRECSGRAWAEAGAWAAPRVSPTS